ncbi:hypothetical protein LOZ12_003422 [Ophidiomyces ophidiicola]|uniref:Uncharacterized protein n=1 Tax=Ophidiomyces ophidiicola TaxID=1387563 RepID=A0ACB8UV49_9EURO|nr:uncharacterized protein LOZ57_004004 [Ophidiomyces ophidiicola]KAI1945753.1 hypothetical protein LOZ57_004004 [Ophidiomyces ophidiicola]KAI1950671.1 hypothetical protein LOZ62_001936 [Ophidiomyces ophidiicola]KAI1972634.1 hypothetical protein LOZ56_002344 [Ophidiomyces ophidiicola]KAI2006615.1 hypothetical protein LOZ50_003000 [Ophidiomyces ophidiicola]KAI2018326.1 hypothetical protein LOZ46_003914 [Ophidiomyces ophidiicola]
MATVIIGGGIVGVSIAYYLSDPERLQRPKDIHIVDSSAELFASASGFAAGFLAKDWFSPEIEPLGKLSFGLHRQLATENDGAEKWGYMASTAISLQVEGPDGTKTKRGDDWLRRGASRAEVAVKDNIVVSLSDRFPAWLTEQKGGIVEKISNTGTVAQVDPLRLCRFLLGKCLERGVQIHYPARVLAVSGNPDKAVLQRLDTKKKFDIACTKLILAAGPWTPRVFQTIFPRSKSNIEVAALSGYSLVFRSPRYTFEDEKGTYSGKSHAVFTTHPKSCGFSPEIFSRHGGEIYIAGLNSYDIPLPEVATDSFKIMEKEKSNRVRRAAAVLMGRPQGPGADNVDDFEIVREALCFRPATENGLPIIGRITHHLLGSNIDYTGDVFVATGHGPWGIALSLGTGQVVAEMVTGAKTSADVRYLGFDPKAGELSSRL